MKLSAQVRQAIGLLAPRSARLPVETSVRAAASAEADGSGFADNTSPQHADPGLLLGAAVLQSSIDAIVATGLDGTIAAWNPAAERLFGFSASEAIGANVRIIIPPERREEHQAIFDWTLTDKPVESLDTIRMTKDGRRIDVSINLFTVKSVSGAIIGAAATLRDISTQKFAEEKFRLAVESCPNGMVMTNRAGGIVMVNGEIERLFGYRREELMDRPIDVLVPERMRGQHFQYRFEYSVQPKARRMAPGRDVFGRRKDGTEFPIEVGLNPIRTRDGLLILSVIVDTTERRQAEEMFRQAVEACPSGMLIADGGGQLVVVNTEIENQFGYRRDELIGQSVDVLLPESRRLQHARYREEFTARPQPRRIAHRSNLVGRRKDGTEFPVEVGLTPLRTAQGFLTVAVIMDITERRRLERLKDEFVSTVSHELRTPLTSIYSSLGLIVGGAVGNVPEPARRLVAIAHKNSQRLVGLVNDILDIEKMESGQLVFKLQAVDARTLIEQTIEANRGYADAYRIAIRFQGEADGTVKADPDRLSQVLTNLLSNAIKFSPPDGEVVVTTERYSQALRISVRDHGPGIPAEFKSRIFEKFAQADATNTKTKGGTGLGLNIVKQIVSRLGGHVAFDDAAGGGTIFHVDLPYWPEPAATGNGAALPRGGGDGHDARHVGTHGLAPADAPQTAGETPTR